MCDGVLRSGALFLAGRAMIVLLLFVLFLPISAILFVQQNELRFYDQLDGLWTFVREQPNSIGVGFQKKWHLYDISTFKNATVMPVPTAYNDVGSGSELRDHVGWAWYQRAFITAARSEPFRYFLRFSSVNYYAVVFFNDKLVGDHVGGHLPFEIEVTDLTILGGENVVTVAVNNTLSHETIPPGEFKYPQAESGGLKQYPDGFFKQTPNFDFFNYAGILRSVYFTKKPISYISDINVEGEADGYFSYKVMIQSGLNSDEESVHVVLRDSDRRNVFENDGSKFSGRVENIRPWWPKGMGSATLYQLEVQLLYGNDIIDVYRLSIGFRSISVTQDEVLINGKPFYCRGFGMHEDFELHGRGFDAVVMVKDMNMLEWMNGNCYRTSHYPYSEERALEADRRGIAVITEVPAVGMSVFSKANQLLHSKMIREMVERDRNHPSVIMWSLSNEPQNYKKESRSYYSDLYNLTRALDKTRPVTIVTSSAFYNDQTADFADVLCVNRYYGWYQDNGFLETVNGSYIFEMTNWKIKFNKPVIVSEYGGDAIPGLNQEPSRDFSEQYQSDLLRKCHEGFDILRAKNVLVGEMIWNFADFMTAQDYTRAVGNHKGMLTRSRQAKMAAYVLKERYKRLAEEEGTSY